MEAAEIRAQLPPGSVLLRKRADDEFVGATEPDDVFLREMFGRAYIQQSEFWLVLKNGNSVAVLK